MSTIIYEKNMVNIKNKMTEIKLSGGKILQNYFGNLDDKDRIQAIYEDKTVVFWADDNGVTRLYFYSSSEEELVDLLKEAPIDSCLEFLTKGDGIVELMVEAGFESEFTMHRYRQKRLTDEERQRLEEYWKNLEEMVYVPGCAKCATRDDAKDIFDKLYEVFDNRESHLCTLEELNEYIDKGWVTCCRNEDGNLIGLQITLVEPGYVTYGYQIWSDNDPMVLANLQFENRRSIKDYLKNIEKEKGITIVPKPSYAWVNKDNRRAVKNVKASGSSFDGLVDYGYRKIK